MWHVVGCGGRQGEEALGGGGGVRHSWAEPGNRRMARGARDSGWGPHGFSPNLLGAGGQISVCMQGLEVLPNDVAPHGAGEQSLKHQVEARPEELSPEEGSGCSSQQPPSQRSRRPKRGPQLLPKRGE